jgi:hypothetical protein
MKTTVKEKSYQLMKRSKIKKDLDDMFIELTDNGFRYELKYGVNLNITNIK